MSMTLIATTTAPSAQASLDFNSIAGTFTDLLVVLSTRNSQTDPSDVYAQFNGDVGSNYSMRRLYGTGVGAASDSASSSATGFRIGRSTGTSYTSNTFSNCSFYIPNYSGSTAKSGSSEQVEENNATSSLQLITACLWSLTQAITSIKIQNLGGSNFATGSTASLYGILKGSGGATVS
jgi:hypothetical protein